MFKRLSYCITGSVAAALLGFGLVSCNQPQYGVSGSKDVGSPSPASSANPTPTSGTKKVSVVVPDPKRSVYIVGEVDASALNVADKITKLGQESNEPIYVILTSPGGSVLTGGQVIAAIESSKAPVYTVCHFLCASMAAMIFEYGTQRYIGDKSFVMFHPASGGADGELDKMVSRLVSMQRYIGKMEAYTATKANLTFEAYKAKASVEAWIDGEDAVANGFADHQATLSIPSDSPFTGLLGARALYEAAFRKKNTNVSITTTSPTDIKWMISPEDMSWFQPFSN
jgi:ATP-dependent Clp protease protease subunit